MNYDDLYREFWAAFVVDTQGPRTYTSGTPTKRNARAEQYRDFALPFRGGFKLVATANLTKDHISAQFFCGCKKGHQFVMSLDPSDTGIVPLRGGIDAQTHLNSSDCKFELFRNDTSLIDRSFWPAHFLWLRIALNELAESLGPKLEVFEEQRV